MTAWIGLSVAPQYIQRSRELLAKHQLLHPRLKPRRDTKTSRDSHLVLVTCVESSLDGDTDDERLRNTLSLLQDQGVSYAERQVEDEPACVSKAPQQSNLHRAIYEAADSSLSSAENKDFEGSLSQLSRSRLAYNVFPPMLLLGGATLKPSGLASILDALAAKPDLRQGLLDGVCKRMNVTHIAVNAPILANNQPDLDTGTDSSNVIRSPSGLQPLYGDFGPALPPFPQHIPRASNFSKAFWVSCRQNGITQVWAPRYTMFSQGNVTEKTRLLTLPSVTRAVEEGRSSGQGSMAVDLFAGIGYFAFSYVKAGVDKVLCWDINPWSVEGLRRGVETNGWQCAVSKGADGGNIGELEPSEEFEAQVRDSKTRLVAFTESNAHASARLQALNWGDTRGLPPVRHVNAGMLPSAAMAWRTAVQLVDRRLGGWVHLHESCMENKLEQRVDEIVDMIVAAWQDINEVSLSQPSAQSGGPRLEHVERVKSMGPKLVHVVLDIFIPAAG